MRWYWQTQPSSLQDSTCNRKWYLFCSVIVSSRHANRTVVCGRFSAEDDGWRKKVECFQNILLCCTQHISVRTTCSRGHYWRASTFCISNFCVDKSQQGRQCEYNTTLRGVRVTIVAVEKNSRYFIFRECARSLRYPACTAHAPYCNLWPVRHYKILPRVS